MCPPLPVLTTDSGIFTVTPEGIIQLTSALSDFFDAAYTVNLTVSVTDKGSPPLNDTTVVVFTIEPSIPQFVQLCADVEEVDEVLFVLGILILKVCVVLDFGTN